MVPKRTEPPPRPSIPSPPVTRVAAALLGFVALGFTAALGSPLLDRFAILGVLPVSSIVGTAVVMGPALVAGVMVLSPKAPIEVPAAALAHGLTTGGTLAFGLVPITLFFVATSGLYMQLLASAFALVGLTCAFTTLRHIWRIDAVGLRLPTFGLAWTMLSALVSIRIAAAIVALPTEVAG